MKKKKRNEEKQIAFNKEKERRKEANTKRLRYILHAEQIILRFIFKWRAIK